MLFEGCGGGEGGEDIPKVDQKLVLWSGAKETTNAKHTDNIWEFFCVIICWKRRNKEILRNVCGRACTEKCISNKYVLLY
jgi:hypothetical protein